MARRKFFGANGPLKWLLLTLVYSFLTEAQHIRQTRGIKDALPKDEDYSHSRSILEMRHKVFDLETTVKHMNTEMDKISSQNNELETSMTEQRALIEKLTGEFGSLKQVISGHAEVIGDLNELASTDDNLFAMSNQTCGGILVGQTGSIVFTSIALRGTRHPSSCIWTIRANNRRSIKVTLQQTYRSYSYSKPNAYVVELVRSNSTNGTINSSNLQTKITRLEKNMHHIFNGPIIFVVYVLTSYQKDEYSEIDLQLHYEGMGKLAEKTTLFSHENLQENSGNFSNLQIDNWNNNLVRLGQNSGNLTYSTDYTSIVISNFTTKVHLQASFENGRCGDRDTSFLVITDLLEDSMVVTDCCETSCDGKNSLINYDNPFVIIITKRIQAPLKFNIVWESETVYPSSSSTNATSSLARSSYYGFRRLGIEYGNPYSHKCGEILGGVTGSLLYKPHVNYRNGERCIWVIVPQPRPRESITINVGANGVETTYDHLYMMELVDVNGTELLNGPRITRLGRYGTYDAYSREVYIVFYSDSSVTGNGFSLAWRSTGAAVKTGKDVTPKFTILKNDDGMASSMLERDSLVNSVYQVFILTPVLPFAYTYGMLLEINQTNPVTREGCLDKDISIYSAMDGLLSKLNIDEIECSEPGRLALENADGMALIVVNDRSADSHVAMNFSWREEYGKGNISYVGIENNNCGGIIRGDKGILKYKISEDYLNNERCVWLLQSPNHTSITLKLLKDGFETCCDHILVTTIDPDSGTLRNDTTVINRQNRTRTFEESVLVVVFRSDASTRGRGFALQFTGNGEPEVAPEYTYQLRHHNEPFGGVAFPSSDWEPVVPGTKNIFVIASSIKIGIDEDPLTMPTNISWTSGVFKKDTNNEDTCDYESVTFYTTPDADGWLKRERFPNENDTASCENLIVVPKQDDICTTVYSAFVVIYKHIASETEEEDIEDGVTRMGFTFEKSAGCGGVVIGDSGKISYKEDGKYSNSEKCVWLVHAPQAQKIRLRLERSGFEECCDILVVHKIDLETGSPEQSGIISQANRTALVDGPIAIIVFTTDSSVTGAGFRLTFTTEENITEALPYTFHLEHRNQPKLEAQFIFKVDSNEMVIGSYSPELLRQNLGGTKLTLEVLRPDVDDHCNSDTLTIYDVYGRERGLVAARSYLVSDVLSGEAVDLLRDQMTNGTCSPLENSSLSNCDSSMLDCSDTPESNVLTMNTTSFLFIYKSVNSTGNLTNRGMVMTSGSNS